MIFTQLLPLAAFLASSLATFTHAAKPDEPPTINQQQQPPKGKAFDHILIILLENTVSISLSDERTYLPFAFSPTATPNYLKMPMQLNTHLFLLFLLILSINT